MADFDLFDEWQTDHKDLLKNAGMASQSCGMFFTYALGKMFLGWNVNSVTFNMVALLVSLAFVVLFYFGWRQPDEAPIWFFGSSNAAYVSACWPCFLVGAAATFLVVYLDRFMNLGSSFNVTVMALVFGLAFWISRRLAIISARFSVDRGTFLQSRIG